MSDVEEDWDGFDVVNHVEEIYGVFPNPCPK